MKQCVTVCTWKKYRISATFRKGPVEMEGEKERKREGEN